MFIMDLIRNSCHLLEFSARLVLVNIPSYLLAKSPEADRISSIAFAYLIFQVVGLCWVFLVNAAFALATRVTAFLPPMEFTNGSTGTVGSLPYNQESSLLSSPYTTVQLIAAFYVSYASIRVVVSFAQSVFHIALESIKDFPDAAQVMSRGGVFTLQLTPIVFVPALILELGLICADHFCSEAGDSVSISDIIQGGICNHTGLMYVTSSYPEVRRLVFYAVIVMVVQIWQAQLHQFPRWDLAFKTLTPIKRLLFQLAVLFQAAVSVLATGLVITVRLDMSSLEAIVCGVMLGWTVWLFSFTPILVATHGEAWANKVTPQSLQNLAAYLRISQTFALVLLYCCVCFTTGFVQAQLDITFATIFLPAMYSCFFLLASACLRAGSTLLMRGVPLALVVSLSVTLLLAKSGGKGGVMLVFMHILGKIIHFFGDEVDDSNDDEEWMEESSENDQQKNLEHSNDLKDKGLVSSRDTSTFSKPDELEYLVDRAYKFDEDPIDTRLERFLNKSSSRDDGTLPIMAESKEKISECLETESNTVSSNSSQSVEPFAEPPIPLKDERSNGLSNNDSSSSSDKNKVYQSRASSDALQLLSERGQADSSFVSLGLPKKLKSHWLVKASQKNMNFLGHLARTVTMSDSFITGIMRAFTAAAAIFTLILCTLSVASVAQQNLQFFPRSFDFEIGKNGTVLFDHKIVNATLYPRRDSPVHPLEGSLESRSYHQSSNLLETDATLISRRIRPKSKVSSKEDESSNQTLKKGPKKSLHESPKEILDESSKEGLYGGQKKPHYAACSWSWHSLSLFDFALLSEVAYFDERQGNQVQELVRTLMPGMGFKVSQTLNDGERSNQDSQGGRAMYLELTSEDLGVTVLAIRGTDIGRLHDFMEDIKMFAEPVLFSMLSGVFPTIRLWSQDTTSRVIEWLYEFNSFFGLQGEAEYYRPLTKRIFEILESSNNSVMITGHSLGGGLARIVGTLTELPSVSFSPPGLALSYRKYSATRPDGSVLSITSKGAMHHESVAVITEFDWITQVDHQVGLVQKILCDTEDKAHQNSCHLLEGTICHLLTHCGDPKQRFSKCEYAVDITAVAPSVISFTWSHRWVLSPIVLILTLMVAFAIVPELL